MTEPSNSLPDNGLTNYTRSLVNFKQTLEERRGKYWLCRSMGLNAHLSIRMRDWRFSKIERCLGLVETYNPHTKAYDRQLNIA